MPKFRLLIVGDADEMTIADDLTAKQLTLLHGKETTLDELAKLGGALITFEMPSPTWEQQQRIRAKGLVASEEKGFAENALATSLATVAESVKFWPVEMAPFVSETVKSLLGSTDADDITAAFKRFHPLLTDSILGWISRKTFPNLADHSDFSKLWSVKPQSSGATK